MCGVVERRKFLTGGGLPSGAGLFADSFGGVTVHCGGRVVPRSVAVAVRLRAVVVVVPVIGGVPAVDGHVDTAAERERVVDHDNLLVMSGPDRVSSVDLEMQPAIRHPVHHEHRGHTAPDRREGPDVPLQQINLQIGTLPGQPDEESSQPIRALERLLVRLELDPCVEVPADQDDAVPGLEHCRFGVAEVVGGVDDARQPIGVRDLPARVARCEYRALVAHVSALPVRWDRPTPKADDSHYCHPCADYRGEVRRSWRIVALLALVSVLWAPTVGAVPVRSDDRPGTVIASSELPAELRLPGAGAAYRMTYRTTDRHGVTPCTGMLFVPAGPPPDGGWPVIAWAHGTVGNSDYDAPSVTGVDTESRDYVSSWLQRATPSRRRTTWGWALRGAALPRRQGRRTQCRRFGPGFEEVDDTLGSSWVTVGLSQGGQASVFAAHNATAYAPELDYRGAVAGGVPSNIELVAPWSGPWFPPQGLAGLTVYMSYLIAGFRDAYPELDLDSYLTEVGRRLVDAAPELPFREFARLTRNVSVAQMLSRGLDAPDLQSALREYLEVPVTGYDRPLLIVQGVTDPSVPFP